MMKSNSDKAAPDRTVSDRRGFLRMIGTGAAGGAAALVAGEAAAETIASEPARKEGELYRETQHIKTYYELAKF
jgi:hypothetical protein